MAILKCKMCGGDLNVTEGVSVCECDYCGTKQTVPAVDDEKKLALFARANRLRLACEFDKAAGIYETIVADFPEEAEAYWGLVLCQYGIEYVDDPATKKKIPTCHRSSFDNVMQDSNFALVLEYADPMARAVYRAEAKQIEELRCGIVAVSSKEEAYDVFICYKETDDKGERTLDSVIAQDVYTALTEKGYRVFFSRITLEDKLGVEYEPYIFAALHSAKVMLAFGTDYEHYNAVWVKNEWSRFLQLIAKGEKKTLIPCYKGIDAYDMPPEFAKLQAQDMGKVGAMQDLVRGVEKILGTEKTVVKETVVMGGNTQVAPLLKRAFMFLEDGEWAKADDFCEQVLNIEPECAEAYLGKLMAELKITKRDDLKNCAVPFSNMIHYQKALRFGDDQLKAELQEIIAFIIDRNKEKAYCTAVTAMENAQTEVDYQLAAEQFGKVKGYKDANALLVQCMQKEEELHQKAEKERKDTLYIQSVKNMNADTVEALKKALEGFRSISDWKDSFQLAQECEQRVTLLEKQRIADAERQKKQEEKRRKKRRIIITLSVVLVLLLLFFGYLLINYWTGNYKVYIRCFNVSDFTIPEGKTTIKEGAFEGCTNLRSVTIPDSVTTIERDAFWKCSNLTELTIPDSVTTIEPNAFAYCSSLTTVTIPDSVTSLGSYAFMGCTGLTEVTIGNGITTIEENTFADCRKLAEITISPSVTAIGENAFNYTNITAVHITNLAAWCNIEFHGTWLDAYREYHDNPLRHADLYVDGYLVADLTIPDGVTTIRDGAFYSCRSLTSVTIPDGVTSIGESAFYSCDSLTTITIPSSVTFIGEGAFSQCNTLSDIYYDGTVEQWRELRYEDPIWCLDATVHCSDGDYEEY